MVMTADFDLAIPRTPELHRPNADYPFSLDVMQNL